MCIIFSRKHLQTNEEMICKTAYRTYHMLLILDQIFFKNNSRRLFLYKLLNFGVSIGEIYMRHVYGKTIFIQ